MLITTRRLASSAVAAAAFIAAQSATTARGEILFGVTDAGTGANGSLVSFDSATPGTVTTIGALSGVVTGQFIRGVEFRPSNGMLYALSAGNTTATATAAQLYTVNLTSGALTPVGSGLTLTGNASSRVSLDVNPVVDALRVVTGTAQNYRVNLNTGALIAQDTSITPADLIADIAYSNNVVGATSTTLYAYDYSTDFLGTIGSVNGTPNSPNGGVYTDLGSVGLVSEIGAIGFDISGATGTGYVSLDDDASADANTEFYTANLSTGALTLVGNSPLALLDLAVRPAAAPAVPEPTMLGAVGIAAVAGLSRRRAGRSRRRA